MTLRDGPPRVVSLVPSLTETLIEWGIRPVAVTRFCEVGGYPTVGGTKNPDIPAIVSLAPDLVLMDREENRRPDAEALAGAGVPVLAVHVRSLADVDVALRAVAAAVGHEGPGGGRAPEPEPVEVRSEPVPVWVPIWRRPWMTVGAATYGSSILAAAGLRNVYDDCPDPYPPIDPAAARARRPAFVLAPSEPYAFKEKHRAELEQVAPAVFVDGKDLFWWGARTPRARRRLAELAAGLGRR